MYAYMHTCDGNHPSKMSESISNDNFPGQWGWESKLAGCSNMEICR